MEQVSPGRLPWCAVDHHIGSLSVLDTVDFAARCLNSERKRRTLLARLEQLLQARRGARAAAGKAAAAAEAGEVAVLADGKAAPEAAAAAAAASNGSAAAAAACDGHSPHANGKATPAVGEPGDGGATGRLDEELAELVAQVLQHHLRAACILEVRWRAATHAPLLCPATPRCGRLCAPHLRLSPAAAQR